MTERLTGQPNVLPYVSIELGYYTRSMHYTRWMSHHEQHMERNFFMISIDNIGRMYRASTLRTTDNQYESIPENRPDSLIKEFDAREQWVAWSSGSATGLLPM